MCVQKWMLFGVNLACCFGESAASDHARVPSSAGGACGSEVSVPELHYSPPRKRLGVSPVFGHDLMRVVCRRRIGPLGEFAPRTWPAAYEAALRLRVPARIDHRDSVEVHRR